MWLQLPASVRVVALQRRQDEASHVRMSCQSVMRGPPPRVGRERDSRVPRLGACLSTSGTTTRHERPRRPACCSGG
ncbi:hypothetical protein FRIGORI9N_120052 [Frigoribacterium sp. 9N]|nr:hypothetical protein FRIGORI9N_120052 [Frigoribacterium sp. 9N]